MSDREYLIKKGSYFYRANKSGYTMSKFEAGRYTEADARKEAEIEPWHMSALHQDEVPDDTASASVGELAEALKTVLASLVATTSLIIRAEDMKVRPSKAVASDTMFLQMLKDYDNATIIGRAAIARGFNHG